MVCGLEIVDGRLMIWGEVRGTPGNHQSKLSKNGIVDALETPRPSGPLGALHGNPLRPCGLLVPFGATGKAFGGQMGSSWAKPGAKCDPNLSQNVSQNVTKSTAEIRSNFGVDLGAYFGPKVMNLRCLLGCGMSFFHRTWNP